MPEGKLDPSAVRKVAQEIPSCREFGSLEDDSVLSFVFVEKNNVARINVYTNSGTIGTCRVLNGQVREIFKRNVSSTNALKRILSSPPTITTMKESSFDEGFDKAEMAVVGMHILLEEQQKLKAHIEAATLALEEREQDVSGMDFEFGLPSKVMKQVEQCLQDILDMGRYVTCVATNGRGAVFLYGVGGVAYTPGIPKALHSKLKSLKRNNTTRPSYVAIGSRDRYYVAFHDGTADWKTSKNLDKCLKRRQVTARSVAFGDKYDSWFVVFDDGSWECRSIPDELTDKLSDRLDRPDLVCVTLGPSGEWFLRAKNGRMWWGGISEELDEMIQSLLESNRFLNFLDFGDDGTYFLSYD